MFKMVIKSKPQTNQEWDAFFESKEWFVYCFRIDLATIGLSISDEQYDTILSKVKNKEYKVVGAYNYQWKYLLVEYIDKKLVVRYDMIRDALSGVVLFDESKYYFKNGKYRKNEFPVRISLY